MSWRFTLLETFHNWERTGQVREVVVSCVLLLRVLLVLLLELLVLLVLLYQDIQLCDHVILQHQMYNFANILNDMILRPESGYMVDYKLSESPIVGPILICAQLIVFLSQSGLSYDFFS